MQGVDPAIRPMLGKAAWRLLAKNAAGHLNLLEADGLEAAGLAKASRLDLRGIQLRASSCSCPPAKHLDPQGPDPGTFKGLGLSNIVLGTK